MLRLDLREEIKAAHSGHVDVGQHEIEPRILLHDLERLLAGGGELEVDASLSQVATKMLFEEQFDIALVINDEDFRSPGTPRLAGDWPARQRDYELCELAGLTLNVDPATVLFHHDVMAQR